MITITIIVELFISSFHSIKAGVDYSISVSSDEQLCLYIKIDISEIELFDELNHNTIIPRVIIFGLKHAWVIIVTVE